MLSPSGCAVPNRKINFISRCLDVTSISTLFKKTWCMRARESPFICALPTDCVFQRFSSHWKGVLHPKRLWFKKKKNYWHFLIFILYRSRSYSYYRFNITASLHLALSAGIHSKCGRCRCYDGQISSWQKQLRNSPVVWRLWRAHRMPGKKVCNSAGNPGRSKAGK